MGVVDRLAISDDAHAPDVWSALSSGRLIDDPYPHLVVENALPRDIADVLLAEMPPLDVFTRGRPPGSNVRFALPSNLALADARVSSSWKNAMRACNSGIGALLAIMLRRFGDELLRIYPDFVSKFGPLDQLRAVPRSQSARHSNEIGMDAQMVVNTPALEGGTSVRGPHLDQPDKLISGLLYLRSPDDDSLGGELELYAPAVPKLTFNDRNGTDWENVRLVRRYPYQHNLLVLPLGSPIAVHGVSPRSATSKPRYHMHLVGQMSAPLFEMPR